MQRSPVSRICGLVRVATVDQLAQTFQRFRQTLADRLMRDTLTGQLEDERFAFAVAQRGMAQELGFDDDPVDLIEHRKSVLDLFQKHLVDDGLGNVAGILRFVASIFEGVQRNAELLCAIRATTAVAAARMIGRSIAFSGTLQLLALLPELTHDGNIVVMTQRGLARIAGEVVQLGLVRSRVDVFGHKFSFLAKCVNGKPVPNEWFCASLRILRSSDAHVSINGVRWMTFSGLSIAGALPGSRVGHGLRYFKRLAGDQVRLPEKSWSQILSTVTGNKLAI